MKERSKERYAQLLMAELLDSLGERESIRALLADMVTMPGVGIPSGVTGTPSMHLHLP